MNITKRGLLQALGASLLLGGHRAWSQTYPSKAIRWIVPYPAGGGADNIARLVTPRMSALLKQSIVVDNRGGGNTIIGTQAMLAAPADGYTLMHTAEQIAANGSLYSDLKYSAEKDVAFIGQIARVPFVLLVHPDSVVKDVDGLKKLVREGGERINYGSWGQGGANHLITAAFMKRAGSSATHIPYQGAAPAVQALLARQIDMYFSDPTVALPYIQSGRLRPIVVSTKARLPYLPDIPTLHESGYAEFDMYSWHGLLAPKGIPAPTVQTLSNTLRTVLDEPQIQHDLLQRGLIAAWESPEQYFQTFLNTQKAMGSVVRDLNIRIQ